jgi:hypothetical protein
MRLQLSDGGPETAILPEHLVQNIPQIHADMIIETESKVFFANEGLYIFVTVARLHIEWQAAEEELV